MAVEQPPLRRRVARLSRLTVALIVIALGLLAVAVVVSIEWHTKSVAAVGRLPVAAATAIPSVPLFVAAGAAAAGLFVGLAALHAAAAMRVLARDRRIPHSLTPEMAKVRSVMLTPLGPSVVRLAEEPELPPSKLPESDHPATGRLQLTVLVPAHNEAATIAATLESLWSQTRPPDRVVVVADNCSDDTAEIARANNADVFTTVANSDKKAGALNQALAELFRGISERDVVMVMDADSVIVPEFLETAIGTTRGRPGPDRGRRCLLRRAGGRPDRATAAQRVRAVPARRSPAASAGCSSSRAPPRSSAHTP